MKSRSVITFYACIKYEFLAISKSRHIFPSRSFSISRNDESRRREANRVLSISNVDKFITRKWPKRGIYGLCYFSVTASKRWKLVREELVIECWYHCITLSLVFSAFSMSVTVFHRSILNFSVTRFISTDLLSPVHPVINLSQTLTHVGE